MHIKQVTICGFRSYKDEVVTAPFSPQHNVVIGRNGNGKSNFFDAIRFALLTSRFASLRADERRALLHEGAGAHALAAFVEIVFDNRDGRLPVDADDVVLRRTIGVQKDEFFLNRKHIGRSDVIHLLESAGFSRANPFYIVQQGKVNALAVMHDAQRLALLKDVAGTSVYDDRRAEALRLVSDAQRRRAKIDDVIAYIDARLRELEAEKDELRAYEALDREQRALAFMQHDHDLNAARAELEALETQRTQHAAAARALLERQLRVDSELAQIEERESTRNSDCALLVETQRTVETERPALLEARAQLELEVQELADRVHTDAATRGALSTESSALARDVTAKRRELDTDILPALAAAEAAHAAVAQQLRAHEQQAQALVARQSRAATFATQHERDTYLQRELTALESALAAKRRDVAALAASVETLAETARAGEQQVTEQSRALVAQRRRVDALGAQVVELTAKRNALSEARKDAWRRESSIAHDVRRLSEQLARGEAALQSTMALAVRRGLQAVRELGASGVSGIFGPLIELVEPVDERFCTAVDEAAGAALFHVVVDTDETATQLMRALESRSLGRVTFLPLNRLKNSDAAPAMPATDDAVPLLDKLRFPSAVRRAVVSAFGKKLLARDLAACARLAAATGMDCVTLDGDVVHRRGALAGGFRDPQRSRTRAMLAVRTAQRDLDAVQDDAQQRKRDAQAADQRVTACVGELQKCTADKQRATAEHARLLEELKRTRAEMERVRASHRDTQRRALEQQHELDELDAQAAALAAELQTPMSATGLTPAERDELHALTAQIARLQTDERARAGDAADLRARRDAIETVLREHLERRQRELALQLGLDSVDATATADAAVTAGDAAPLLAESERDNTLRAKTLDLEAAQRAVAANEAALQDAAQRLAELRDAAQRDETQRESLAAESAALTTQLAADARRAERVLGDRQRLLAKREDATRAIRELGPLPTAELAAVTHLAPRDVLSELARRSARLERFSHVNKKALDQYVSFSDQRATLLARKRELDAGHASIQDLVDVLDRRKDEAILRTFKGVAHHFAHVFRELVPTGDGKMLILKAGDARTSSRTSSRTSRTGTTDTDSGNSVDTFAGVQIRVSFRGEGDAYLMQQLSGGQKALVALAFIFAIQRCDPAPFYLLDEIDAALDATHRAAVAALIHRQAHSKDNPAQFITSTFRPEFVSVADQFYGIGYQNKISSVYAMTQREALDFIGDIMAEDGDGEAHDVQSSAA